MIDELINKQVEEYREKFCKREELICECGHHPEAHYWNGGDNYANSGYDSCRIEGCSCVYDESKITTKEVIVPNEFEEAHLVRSMKKVAGEIFENIKRETGQCEHSMFCYKKGKQFKKCLICIINSLTDKGE